MKKKALACAICFAASVAIAKAQTTLSVDFSNLSAIQKHYVYPYGTKVQIKVINLNTFLYNISENRADSEYNTAIPGLLSALALPPFLTADLAAPANQAQVKAQRQALSDQSNATTKEDIHKEMLLNLRQIKLTEDQLNEMVSTHNSCVNISKDCNLKTSDIITKVIAEIVRTAGKYNIPQSTIENMSNQWLQEALAAITVADHSYIQMNELYERWKTKIVADNISAVQVKNAALTEAKFKLGQLTDALNGIKDPKKNAAAQQAVLAQQHVVDDAQATLNNQNDGTQTNQKNEQDLMTKAQTLITDIDGYQKNGTIYTLFNDFKTINASNYAFYSETIHLKKDETKLTFTVTSKQPLPCDNPNQTTFDVDLRPRGGLKVDFSSGIFISGGGSSFAGNTYYYKPVTDSASTIATPNVKSNLVLSLGALVHIYFRSPNLIKPALSVGASISTGATVYNLHVGPSLIIGNRNRLIATAGLTLRQSTLLDNTYNTNTVYSTSLLPATVPTVNKFPIAGWFFSLTYDISSL